MRIWVESSRFGVDAAPQPDIYLFGARTGESSRAAVPSRASAPIGYQKHSSRGIVYVPVCRLNDVFVVAQDALVPEQLFDLCANKVGHHGADNCGHRLKPGARTLQALIPDQVRVSQDKCIVFLERALHEERDRSLLRIEVRVGIDTAGPDQMIPDDRRIRDT